MALSSSSEVPISEHQSGLGGILITMFELVTETHDMIIEKQFLNEVRKVRNILK